MVRFPPIFFFVTTLCTVNLTFLSIAAYSREPLTFSEGRLLSEDNEITQNLVDQQPSTLQIRGFKYQTSTVFSVDQLDNIVERKLRDIIQEETIDVEEGQLSSPINLTFEQILSIRSAITRRYLDEGYTTSFAYVPTEQEIPTGQDAHEETRGIVEIAIVEGTLSAITVGTTDCQSRSSNMCQYLLERLSGPLNQRDVERVIRSYGEILIQNSGVDPSELESPIIEARLEPVSEGSANSKLIITFQRLERSEPPHFNLAFGIDNSRSPSIGSEQRRLRFSSITSDEAQATFNIEYTNTEGSNALGLGIDLAEIFGDQSLVLDFDIARNKLIDEPFNELDIISESIALRAAIRGHFVEPTNRQFNWTLGLAVKGSDTEALGVPIALSTDADEEGRTRIAVLEGALDYSARSPRQALFLQGELALGNNLNEPPFLIPRLQGQWVRRIGGVAVLALDSQLQIATDNLPALEQIGIGGPDTVRGYRRDALLSDNAFLTSLEVQIPVLRFSRLDGSVQLRPFIDFGTAWNDPSNPSTLETSTLWSTGLGLGLQFNNLLPKNKGNDLGLSFNIDYGFPQIELDSRGRSLQEEGLHFSAFTTWSFD